MKFTLAWLKEHLATDATLGQITDALTDLGLEVEPGADPAAALGAFTIARVIEAAPHPNADKLRVCRVEVRDGPGAPPREVQVVCGAPNARAGLVGVFAAPGTHIPGTGVDLKPGVIRGVASDGMLCSGRELMLSDDHDGILDLPADAPVGARYIDYAGLADPVIEIKITPNRPDALAVAGVARDLAARGLGRLVTPPVVAVPGAYPCPIGVTLAPGAACPHFAGRLIRGVRNGPSPAWLQRRLRAIGLRPISALVDVTNLVAYDRARPLHVFDAARLSGDIVVRLASLGEALMGLDDREHALTGEMTVIADDAGPLAVAGIIGGRASGCTEATTEVFLEAAWFEPVAIAATGRRLKVTSDARYRFERGVDPEFTVPGLELATRLILDLCGGEASAVVQAGRAPDTARSHRLDPARVESLVGMAIPREDQVRILTDLGFSASGSGPVLEVWVPSWRADVQGEADLVEEVARVVSLSGLVSRPLARPAPGVMAPTLTAPQARERLARRTLAAGGGHECVTYSFIPGRLAALFGGGAAMRLENPISADLSDMRPDLLPGLLAAAARNQARGFGDLALFEVGPVFFGPEPGDQRTDACALRVGQTAPRHWAGGRRPVDLADARGDAEAVLAALGVPVERLGVARGAPEWFHPGRSATLRLGPKQPLAVFGELHPRVIAALDLRGPVVAAVVDLGAIPVAKAKGAARPALALSDLPAVERDFAFVLDARVEAEAVLRAVRGVEPKLIARAEVFDRFEGAALGAGAKSLAVTVRLEPRVATLTEAEIEAVCARIVAAVAAATGGVLRG